MTDNMTAGPIWPYNPNKEKENKKMKTKDFKFDSHVILIISRILAILMGVVVVALVTYYFVKARNFSMAEYLPMVIPVSCVGLMTIAIVVYLRRIIKNSK